MDKILIVKTSALGDVVHTYPVITYLRNKFPNATIDWVVEASCRSLVQAHPGVSRAIVLSSKAWRKEPFSQATRRAVRTFIADLRSITYDVLFDLQGNIKSGLITSAARAQAKVGFGWKSVAEKPNWLFTRHHYDPCRGNNIRQDYLNIVSSHFQEEIQIVNESIKLKIVDKQQQHIEDILGAPELLRHPLVMVSPGSAWKNKQLNLEALISFLQLMKERYDCAYIFSWGTDNERQIVEELHRQFVDHSIVLDKLDLPSLQNLMSRCKLVIAVDSLPLHLAGTAGVPTFSIFGPSLAAKYTPIGEGHIAMQGECPYKRSFDKRCPILRSCPTGACIRTLQGEDLFRYFIRRTGW